MARAIADAKFAVDKPTLIICKTSIGKGSPNRANTAKAHGEPLGAEEIRLTREALGWSHPPFVIPQDVYDDWNAKGKGRSAETAWDTRFSAYQGREGRRVREGGAVGGGGTGCEAGRGRAGSGGGRGAGHSVDGG